MPATSSIKRLPATRVALAAALALVAVASLAMRASAQSYNTTDSGVTVDQPDKTYSPGQNISIDACCFQPGSLVSVYFHSDPVLLGKLTADSTGAIHGSFTVPADVPTGDHTVTAEGVDATGAPLVLSLAVQVTADGDVPDALSFTGSTTAPLVVGGVGLVLVGAMVVRFNRRRSGATASS